MVLIDVEVVNAPLDYNILFGLWLYVLHEGFHLFYILYHDVPPSWEYYQVGLAYILQIIQLAT